ncbi:MAG: HD domain-containing phosphohydrolase [Thiobacillaceae bacterium]
MGEPVYHILAVDDLPENLLILEDLLGDQYILHTAANGREAIEFFQTGNTPDLILLDVMMPEMDGFEVCRRLKGSPETQAIPVLFLTSKESSANEEKALALGAADFIHKPFSPQVVLARVRNHLNLSVATRALREQNDQLGCLVAERTRQILLQSDELVRYKQEVIAAQGATITAFCSLAEARDNETGNHIRRTQNYVRALAEYLVRRRRFPEELNDEVIQLLHKSAPLHDVGKVAIPDSILLKPGKLTQDEWNLMKRHCEYGRDVIIHAERELGETAGSFLRYAREIAYCHHEKWDGSGYPQGLAGDDIPLSARLMAVADVYDALISRRVYKPAYPHEQAVAMILAERGRHFDPDVAGALLEIAGKFRSIAQNLRDDTAERAEAWEPSWAQAPKHGTRIRGERGGGVELALIGRGEKAAEG